jgi:hypothetical protein
VQANKELINSANPGMGATEMTRDEVTKYILRIEDAVTRTNFDMTVKLHSKQIDKEQAQQLMEAGRQKVNDQLYSEFSVTDQNLAFA